LVNTAAFVGCKFAALAALVTIVRHSLFEEFLHGPEDAWARAVSFGSSSRQ